MEQQIITIEQLPIVKIANFEDIENEINNKLAGIDFENLVTTEENFKDMKSKRAELNKDKNRFKEAYDLTIEQYMKPITEVRQTAERILDKYKKIDVQLKSSISVVEDRIQQETIEELKEHFEENCQFDFINFEQIVKLNSVSTAKSNKAKFKKETEKILNKITEELTFLENQEDKMISDLAVIKYEKTLNSIQALQDATNEVNTLRENDKRQALQAQKENNDKLVAQAKMLNSEPLNDKNEVPEIIEPEPKVEVQQEQVSPTVKQEQEFLLKFWVKGSKDKLVRLKQFLESEGIEYGNIK